jgi:hypothetical protein
MSANTVSDVMPWLLTKRESASALGMSVRQRECDSQQGQIAVRRLLMRPGPLRWALTWWDRKDRDSLTGHTRECRAEQILHGNPEPDGAAAGPSFRSLRIETR